MSVYQGTCVTKYITITDHDTELPIDITDWTFRAQLRSSPASSTVLSELTTENGGFLIVDGVNGRLALVLDDSVTELLPTGRISFDVLRENGDNGPVWMFGGSFVVKQPITR